MKIFYFLSLSLFSLLSSNAQKTWTGASGGNWSLGTNWSPAGAPGSGDDVTINNTANMTINLDVTPININSITILGGSTFSVTLASPISSVAIINLGVGGSGSGVALAHNVAAKVLSLAAGGNATGAGGGGVIINIPTGYTASIGGTLSMTNFFSCNGGGTGCNTHMSTGRPLLTGQLIGQDAGSIVFNSTAICNVNYSENVSPFYSGSNNTKEIVVFQSGSSINHYIHYPLTNNFFGQAFPNPTVKLEQGNVFNFPGSLNGSQTIDVTSRTYRDVNFNFFPSSNVVMTLQNNATAVTDVTSMGNLTVNSGSVLLQTATTATVADITFSIGDISLGQTTAGRTNVLRFAGNTGSKFNNVFISGNVLIGHPTLASTNTLTFGPATGSSATTTNVTFTGVGKSISFGAAGTNTFNTQLVPTSNTANVNYTIASGASFTYNIPTTILTLSTAAAPFTQTSMNVKPTGVLIVGSSSTIAAGGRLTIESNVSGTGSIGNSTGSITGSVIVQRYIPFQRGYRTFGHPFTTTQTLAGLNAAFAITGSGTGFNSSAAASAFSYNPTAISGAAFEPLSNIDIATTAWVRNQGIMALVRGNGTQGINFDYTTGTTATTVSMTGAINQGLLPVYNLGYDVAGTNYNLIANPYPSPINLKNLFAGATNAGSSYWVYDPRKNFTTTTVLGGGYNTGTFDAATDVIIPSFGAFFLQTTAAGSITFTEAAKSTATPLALFNMPTTTTNKLTLAIENGKGYNWDDVKIRFDENATENAKDKYDAGKLSNQLFDLYSLAANKERLAIDSRSLAFGKEQIISLGIKTSVVDTYTFKLLETSVDANTTLVLRDKYLQKETPLTQISDSYSFAITADADSKGDNRFELVVNSKPTASVIATDVAANAGFKASIVGGNIVTNDLNVMISLPTNRTASITLTNELGQVIATKQATATGNINFNAAAISKGLYFVSVQSGDEKMVLKAVKQ